jgi:hypothetical protein
MAATRTYSHVGAEGGEGAIATGLLTSAATPLAELLEVGFQPSRIEIVNYTSTNTLVYIWTKGMTSGNAYLMTGSTGVYTKVTGGPTVFTGGAFLKDSTTVYTECPAGFVIPAALQSNADTWSWTAWR